MGAVGLNGGTATAQSPAERLAMFETTLRMFRR
jgi:hypothetical protein